MNLSKVISSMYKFWMVFAIAFFVCTEMNATHNRAGEITFEQTGPLTISVTITTYTKSSSSGADRDSLELFWGDGTSSYVIRTNGGGSGVDIGNDIKINIYEANHTFPGRGTYEMGFEDPNRVGGILNVNWPNSIDIRFFLSTTITFLDPQFDGTNTSARLLQAPVDVACAGKRFIHNPNAFDPDGDSLSYEFAVPLMAAGTPVPNYQLPNLIGAGPNNNISLNPYTGEFVWDSPQLLGEYNLAIKINEWRNGQIISSITRDMQILVKQCDNDPPTVENEEQICVIAGSEINIGITIDDINEDQLVKLTGSGAPFLLTKDNASLSPIGQFLDPRYDANFNWTTTCNHISDRPYQLVFKAEDNGFSDSTGLVDLSSLSITVVGPPPENLLSETESGAIRLTWDNPYSCQDTDNNFYQGFSVWRRKGMSSFELDSCITGLEKYGYEKIKFNTTDTLPSGPYTFLDSTAENGITYCYRVQAEFAQISATGIPYNRIASLPSNEICQQLSRNLPLITEATVNSTSDINGEITVRWTKPLAEDLDTLENPGPYRYELYTSNNNGNTFSILSDFTILVDFFSTDLDTIYNHNIINTQADQFYYHIKFYSNGNLVGQSSTASSIFLNLGATDMLIDLNWEVEVPWSNRLYYIHRKEMGSTTFEVLDSTRNVSYIDSDLENGKEYCYYIQSLGSYALPSLPNDIWNDSQESCIKPIDNVPPCSPELIVSNICDQQEVANEANLFNILEYTNPNLECNFTDAIGYYIYYSEIEGGELILVDSILDIEELTFEHSPATGLSGCYAISAIDENRNESPLSNIVCVDNCPRYVLPNTFSPNGDGANDEFVPRLNIFIESVEFTVFNEWGNKVWFSTDPNLNWDGKTSGGSELSEGVYYYTCKIFERRVQGITESTEILKGHINILK